MATRKSRLALVDSSPVLALLSAQQSDPAARKPLPHIWANQSVRSVAAQNIDWISQRQAKTEFGALLPLQISFLTAAGISPALLFKTAAEARALKVYPEEVLLKNNVIDEITFYSCLAGHLGLRFIDWPVFLQQDIAYPQAIQTGLVPLRGDEGAAFLAAPRGETLYLLLEKGPRGIVGRRSLAITTPRHLAELVRAASALHVLQGASFALSGFDADLTAFTPPKRIQALGLNALILTLFIGLAIEPKGFFPLVSLLLGLMFFAGILYRLLVSAASFLGSEPISKTIRQKQTKPYHRHERSAADRDLPLYSIVIALHKEARVVKKLVSAIERIDYPRPKLEIKLVIESGDSETLKALKAENLGFCYEIITAPPGWPKTKPRALNIALPLLRGKLVTIFDAEDEPEPGQLRQAAARFAQSSKDLACLQARLAIDNVEDCWLTKLFAIEYAILFDVLNKGISELSMPLPLGGTSNHFRTTVLRRIRGWDAWNMTEDADLGIRLARFGYRVETFASTTLEEAPAKLGPWLKQRRRWFKGWMQTAFVLSRDPARVYREVGLRRSIALVLSLITLVISPLVSPICGLLVAVQLFVIGIPEPQTMLELVEIILWTSVALFGSASTVWLSLLGMKRRGLLSLWPSLMLVPAYYFLMFLAAWGAFYDFIFNPFHWHKTEHGLAKTSKRRPLALRISPRQSLSELA